MEKFKDIRNYIELNAKNIKEINRKKFENDIYQISSMLLADVTKSMERGNTSGNIFLQTIIYKKENFLSYKEVLLKEVGDLLEIEISKDENENHCLYWKLKHHLL